jgi:two-component system chemotaxis sensor kinase CheA
VIPEDDFSSLDNFIQESRAMVQKVLPVIRQLLAAPEQENLLVALTSTGYRLFHSMRSAGALFHLEHLIAPAEAMETLLAKAQSNPLTLSLQHIALIAEVCTFTERGLELVAREKSDQRLAATAGALQAAIFELLQAESGKVGAHLTLEGITPEMREAFLNECGRLLATAEQEFVLWDFIAFDHDRVADLCRVLHRLKQNFNLYECTDFERLCMVLESTLHRYLQGEFFQTEYPERVFLRCIDAMRESLSGYALAGGLELLDMEEHLRAAQSLIRQPLGELLIEAGLVDPKTVDEALSLQRSAPGNLPRRLGEVLVAMGEVTTEQVHHVLEEQQRRHNQATNVMAEGGGRGASMPPRLARVPLFPQQVKVDGQILARMASVVQHMAALSLPAQLQPFVDELEQMIGSLSQDCSFGLAQQLQRMVHDFAVEYRQRVHCRIEGARVLENELDLAGLSGLLAPLLRNAVEHGAKQAGGQRTTLESKKCRISVSALCQDGEIWVSIEDNGPGLDLKKIAQHCLDQGMVDREELSRCTGSEVLQIFLNKQPRLADAALIDTARCTGLAFVKKKLSDLNGRMDIWSRPGKGTRITLRLPRHS